MIGWRFIKVQPTDFVMQYSNGKLVRQGAGLSFFYFAPTTSLVLIPLASRDISFTFEESTSDFQQITIEGQFTCRVVDPIRLSQLMNFTLAANRKDFESDDPKILFQRLVNHTQMLTRSCLKSFSLEETLTDPDLLVDALRRNLENARAIGSLGIEILGLNILAIKPTPEMARTLEALGREQLLLKADWTISPRKKSSAEQALPNLQNELNTEIAFENRKQQARKPQLDPLKKLPSKEAQASVNISPEEENKKLVALAVQGVKPEENGKRQTASRR